MERQHGVRAARGLLKVGQSGPISDVEAAERLGIDLSSIEESLRLMPEQRAVEHQRALDLALQLEAAWQSRTTDDARTESAAADTLRR